MNLKRGSVLGGIVFSLVLMSTVEAQAQQGLAGRVAALEAALAAETAARQAADTALQNAINAISGGVTQAAVDAAIAAEATARATADGALEGQIANEAAAIAALDVTVTALADTVAPLASLMPLAPLATYVSVNTGAINGLAGPHILFTGANVHIRSGHVSGDSLEQNGRGNLIVGYNESGGYVPAERGGSHNVVVGPYHRYNFGVGFVAGYNSRLGGDGASVSAGFGNNAGAEFSSVSGGSNNHATGMASSVSGGDSNTAIGGSAAVSAGQLNQASGDLSSVSGGFNNAATAVLSTVGGGASQTNGVGFTFVP